jgi:hypothetical protein
VKSRQLWGSATFSIGNAAGNSSPSSSPATREAGMTTSLNRIIQWPAASALHAQLLTTMTSTCPLLSLQLHSRPLLYASPSLSLALCFQGAFVFRQDLFASPAPVFEALTPASMALSFEYHTAGAAPERKQNSVNVFVWTLLAHACAWLGPRLASDQSYSQHRSAQDVGCTQER